MGKNSWVGAETWMQQWDAPKRWAGVATVAGQLAVQKQQFGPNVVERRVQLHLSPSEVPVNVSGF